MRVVSMALLLLLLATLVFVACELNGTPLTGGSLKIIFSDDVNARTIKPDLHMDVASYKVSCIRNGSSDRIGPVDVQGSSYMFEGILEGSWIITVEAYNGDTPPVKIGEGSKEVTVTKGSTTETSVSIVPVTGNGTFTFTLDWTGNLIGSAQIEAFLTPEKGSSEIPIDASDISILGSVATITVDMLGVGYYDFSYVLKEGNIPIAGNFHEVRILAGQTSSASETIPVSPLGINASIVNNLCNPFSVNISSDDYVMERTSVQPFTVSPANCVAYQWYLDGMKIAGANESTYHMDGEAMPFGWHNLSVKVKKADGWLSSGTVAFLMDESAGDGLFINLEFTSKTNSADTWELSMASGPAEDSVAFNAMGTYPGYNIPIHFEMIMEKTANHYQPGSFMVASSVPLTIGANYNMYPMAGEGEGYMVTGFGAWGVDATNVLLDHPYSGSLFMAFTEDAEGKRKTFDCITNVYNPNDGPGGTLRWGELVESEDGGVSITFTKYGDGLGSYVKGTISGTVASVIPAHTSPYTNDTDTLGYYSVSGTFITSRGIWTPPSD